MLKKIHVIKLLISKANNFEAIINKDRVTFPPKCFGGGGALQITITKEKGISKIAAPIYILPCPH